MVENGTRDGQEDAGLPELSMDGLLDGMNDLAGELLGVSLAPTGLTDEGAPESVGSETFQKNLAMMSLRNPGLVSLLRKTRPDPGVSLDVAPDGGLTGSIERDGVTRTLASKRAPLDEADRLASKVELTDAAIVIVRGLGVGHHVRALAERHKGSGALIVFEPDLGLLRAVLERENMVDMIAKADVRFVHDPHGEVELSAQLAGIEGLVSMGVRIVDHPASAARLGPTRDDFGVTLARCVSAVRTHVVTTLMQSGVTIRNELMNLDAYARTPGISHLRDAASGRHAVVVSAGPSFRRNVEQLGRAGIRDRVVIIAVQTVLKPLLELGIKPHFVTALDYHEISTRFYEGLTAEDVEGVTLVAEAKANPAILEAFPGRVICPQDDLLDTLLGKELLAELGGDRGRLARGATVAHLAYYLARYLGCDPVALIGQDLAFTDGQYYAGGAAIHSVWAPELGEFNTLEMMEWQRIVRMRKNLHARRDTLGRHVYSDEQMVTYLMQFERDFMRDQERGLLTIDATEGGVEKQGTVVRPLSRVLEDAALLEPLRLPEPRVERDETRRLVRRLRDVRASVWKVGECSSKSAGLLEQMIEKQDDVGEVNRLIGQVHALRDRVRTLEPAMELVQTLNQTGTLKRAKADREIFLERRRLEADETMSERDRKLAEQRARMGRDLTNVRWLADAADEMGELLDSAVRALTGGAKLTRDPTHAVDERGEKIPPSKLVAWAVMPCDPAASAWGIERDLSTPVFEGEHALSLTLERLSRARSLAGVVIATPDANRVRALLGGRTRVGSLSVEIMPVDRGAFAERQASVRTARSFAGEAWRGGLGGWTVFDEVFHPATTQAAAELAGADAVVLVGPDWCAIDPALVDATVVRLSESPETHRLTFSQAACGLGACVLSRGLVDEIGAKCEAAGTWGSIGALLGYVPPAPAADPIGRETCVRVPAGVRDVGERLIADSAAGVERLGELFAASSRLADASELAEAAARLGEDDIVREVVVEAIDRNGRELSAEALRSALAGLGSRCCYAVTLTGERDPSHHEGLGDLIRTAREAGAASVHVRTDLSRECGEALIGADIVSCDLHALSSETYRELTGEDSYDITRARLKALLDARVTRGGVPSPWVVPRMTRRDAVYEQIEAFFDESLMACGAAVIDPLPGVVDGERIRPLPVPERAARRMAARRVRVLASGELVRAGLLAASEAA